MRLRRRNSLLVDLALFTTVWIAALLAPSVFPVALVIEKMAYFVLGTFAILWTVRRESRAATGRAEASRDRVSAEPRPLAKRSKTPAA